MATMTTLGIPELDRRLQELGTREANKISRSALNQGLTVLAQAERSAIDSEGGLSPELRTAMKKTVGKRLVLKESRNQAVRAKAGLGVGQRPRGPVARQRAKSNILAAAAQRSEKKRSGVGISANNIQWFALGTKQRSTEKGYNRGRLDPVKVIRRAGGALPAVFARVRQVTLAKFEEAVNRLRSQK